MPIANDRPGFECHKQLNALPMPTAALLHVKSPLCKKEKKKKKKQYAQDRVRVGP
jgi:hypothetical protein